MTPQILIASGLALLCVQAGQHLHKPTPIKQRYVHVVSMGAERTLDANADAMQLGSRSETTTQPGQLAQVLHSEEAK